jgi:parallel beta-helix repeat protein
MYTSPAFSGYTIRNTIFRDNGIGLHLGSDGVCQTWVRDTLFVANNEFTGADAGNGIYASEGTVRVLIADNLFKRHNGAGILFADHPDRSPIQQRDVFIKRNQSVDDLTFAAFYASSHVHVAENLVAAHEGDPDPHFRTPAAGIFVGARNHHIAVKRNRITSASGNGIDVRSSADDPELPEAAPEHVQVVGNKVTVVEQHGIEVDADGAGEYQVRGNLALRNKQVGIHLGPDTHENRVAGNTALGNLVLDCQDQSHGDGTARPATPGATTWAPRPAPTASAGGAPRQAHQAQAAPPQAAQAPQAAMPVQLPAAAVSPRCPGPAP